MSARQERGLPTGVVLTIALVVAIAIVAAGMVLHLTVGGPGRAAPAVTAPPSTSATKRAAPSSSVPANTPTEAAAGFVAAFTDHAAPADAWEKQYSSYLTKQAKTAYAGTDREQVPGTRVTGKAIVTAGASAAPVPGSADDDGDTDPVPAIVAVPTDAGRYTVNLQQQDGRWLVVSAQLPGSGQ